MKPQQQPNSPQPVPRKIRGTLTIKADDDLEFRAQRSTGVSSQEEIAKTATGKLYRTVGEKKNSMVAHITVPDGEQDVRAFLYDSVDKLTQGLQTKARPRLRGRILTQNDSLRVTLNQKERQVEVVMSIDLNRTPNYNDRLMKLMYETSQCFAINQTSLAQPKK